jgi:hypothetical protein
LSFHHDKSIDDFQYDKYIDVVNNHWKVAYPYNRKKFKYGIKGIPELQSYFKWACLPFNISYKPDDGMYYIEEYEKITIPIDDTSNTDKIGVYQDTNAPMYYFIKNIDEILLYFHKNYLDGMDEETFDYMCLILKPFFIHIIYADQHYGDGQLLPFSVNQTYDMKIMNRILGNYLKIPIHFVSKRYYFIKPCRSKRSKNKALYKVECTETINYEDIW